ncbi:type II toxin-antitoxin system RelE/ParE family toxin [Pseudoduganella violacea]|nr:type II toxin-antitoxin system RelE/ParE family toxin [Pseudoduganella violacea]
MIVSFASRDTAQLFAGTRVARFDAIERVARRKLMVLHAASDLKDLSTPPGNHLKALSGNRVGQYSIRINERWRICFRWLADGAYEVEVVDYR